MRIREDYQGWAPPPSSSGEKVRQRYDDFDLTGTIILCATYVGGGGSQYYSSHMFIVSSDPDEAAHRFSPQVYIYTNVVCI